MSDGAAKANAKQFTDDVKDDAAAAVISEANKFLQIQETKGKKDQGKVFFTKIRFKFSFRNEYPAVTSKSSP